MKSAVSRSTRTLRVRPCAQAAACLVALLAPPLSVLAQTAAPAQRVEITGSSIKRIDGETALPVQTIQREDIIKSGVTTAAELLQKISANVGGLTDGASISDVSGAQRGFNGANLRGLGVSSTLVLLNGRRLANFATPGDNAGVDLNNIPVGAIQRVEVLKDGASAIYGTDAMGGVINFITRKDYQGGDLSVYALATQEGGAGKQALTASGGIGDLARDGYNVFASVDVQKLGSLNSSQRSFIREYDLPGRLPPQLSSNPFPANVDLTAAQLITLNSSSYLRGSGPGGKWLPSVPGSSARRVNLSKDSCTGGANPSSVSPTSLGGTEGCAYNYMGDTEIYPESQKANLIGRATFQVAPDHQVFAEFLFSKSETDYAASPATSSSIRTSAGITLPASLQTATGIVTPVAFRFRLQDAGKRTSRVESEATRLVIGANGRFGDWDYDAAFNHSVNKATDTNKSGWVSFAKMLDGIKTFKYNPFQPATDASGKSFMDSIAVNGGARMAEGKSDSLDGKLSRALGALDGGDLMLALGAELRREQTAFSSTQPLKDNDTVGDRASSGALLADTSNKRNVKGIFAELSAPFTKQWEGQFAIRHDRYDGVYDPSTQLTSPDLNTTNPKVGLSYRPSKGLLVRSSYGTGFRAPSIAEMFLPLRSGTTACFVRDPVSGETNQMAIDRSSNPDLKPEKSKQFSAGLVFEMSKSLDGSIDFWRIRKTDIISEIGEETIFTNPVYYNDPAIVHRSGGFVDYVSVKKENRGNLNTAGFDVALNWRGEATAIGRFASGINGTYITEYKFQTDPRSPLVDGLGRFRDDKAVQRWRHKVNVDWDYGNLGLTLSNTYLSGYRDQNTEGLAATAWNNRDVKAYSLFDLTGSYSFTPKLRLRAGILNLADTAPPFTNQSRYFQVTWDPTYGDPRGRSFFANMQYQF